MDAVGMIVPGENYGVRWPNYKGKSEPARRRVENEAVRLARAMVDYACGREPRWNSKYVQTMKRVVDDLLARHEIVFTSMVRKLKASSDNWSDASTPVVLTKIIDEMFEDGVYNWGRVCSIYALLVRVVQQRRDEDMLGDDALADAVGHYVEKRLGGKIEQLGDWDAFVDHFPSPTALEDGIRKGLLWTAVVGAVGFVAMTAASRLS